MFYCSLVSREALWSVSSWIDRHIHRLFPVLYPAKSIEVSSPFILTAHDPIKLTSFLNRWVATKDQLMSLKWKVCQKKTFWKKKFIELSQCMYVLSVWKHWQELASLTSQSHFCPHPLCSLNKMFQFFKCTTFNFVQLQIRMNDKAVFCTN